MEELLCFIKDEWTLASTEPVIFVLGDNENCSVGLSSSVMDEHLLEYEPVEGFVAGAFKYSFKKIYEKIQDIYFRNLDLEMSQAVGDSP